MERSRSAFAALGLLLACALGGCSSQDPVPKVAPASGMSESASASASASATPSGPVKPVMPAAAKKHTAAGAEAFVRFYWEMADYAQATGDTSGLSHLGSPGCKACHGGIRAIDVLYEQGGRIRGGGTSLSGFHTFRVSVDPPTYQVRVAIRNSKQVVQRPGDKHDEVYPPSVVHARFLVDLLDTHWSIGYWEDVS
ncbi:DUF6318 family protein [Nocardioides panaciterrulae]|uniref:DUF6318 domain-containing protein n=1 Tax=Nocardioides panaciterrulae TaxID=661492 RepID=A0A7Y9JCC4_9ACTN|nr:DUF6318 family protein [Nocardioides panaciterrulae]NYD43268.1 hypothetical protein [Nocardioides panaciterrulae]